MAATAGLSIAANAFAVVGIAEVVCRTGKDLYDVLCKLRHASTEVDYLLSTVRVLRSSTDAARQYLSDVVQLPPTQAREAATTQLTNLLNAIQSELIKLSSIAMSAVIYPSDDWLLRIQKKTRIVSNEKNIQSLRHVLGFYTNSLMVILSSFQGRQQISLHVEVGEVRKDITAVESSITKSLGSSSNIVKLALEDETMAINTKLDTATNSIRTTILDTSVPLLQAFQSAATSNEHSHSDLKAIVSKYSLETAVQIKSLESNMSSQAGMHDSNAASRHFVMSTDIARFSEQNKNAFRSVEQQMQCNNTQQLIITNNHDRFQKAVEARLAAIQATMTRMAEVNVTETADGSFVVSGLNLGEIELPLLLAKSHLVKAIPVLSQMESVRLSMGELSWLNQELDSLKDQATAFSYHSAHRSTPHASSNIGIHEQIPGAAARQRVEAGDREPPYSGFVSESLHYLDTPVGTIFLQFRRKEIQHPSGRVSHAQKICLQSMPRMEICGIGFSASVHRSERQLPLYKQVCVYNVLPDDHVIFQVVFDNDWKALEHMLRQDRSLLHVRNDSGYSLATCALLCASLETFETIVKISTDMSRFGEHHWLTALTFVDQISRERLFEDSETGEQFPDLEKRLHGLRTALAAGMEFVSSKEDIPEMAASDWASNPVFTETISLLIEYEQTNTYMADELMELFFRGCPNTLGNLPRESIGTAAALLSKSTNPQLIDSHGRNILHWSFGGNRDPLSIITYEIPTLLSTNPFEEDTVQSTGRSKLRLSLNHSSEGMVIKAGLRSGADPNALSNSGRPPFGFTTAEHFLSTALHLKSLGYVFVKVPRIWLYDAGIILIKDSGDKLPVSGLSIEEYLQKRESVRKSVLSVLWEDYLTFNLHMKWSKVRKDECFEPVMIDMDDLESLAREIEWEVAMVSETCGPMDYKDDDDDHLEPV